MPHYSYPLTASSGVMIALDRDAVSGRLTAQLEAPALQTNANTLLQQLSKFTEISDGTNTYRFEKDANGNFQLTPSPTGDISALTVRVRGVDYGNISITDNDLITARINHQLTAFEVRVMSQGRNGIYPLADRTQEYTPRTDLHTHFAGALSGEDLIAVGLAKETGPVLYPAHLLAEADIDSQSYGTQIQNGQIALADLTSTDRDKLANAMSIPLDTQDTFNGMEKIYALRGPITKDKELFKPLLWALGRDFQQHGVAYSEQSFSALINDPDLMRVAHEELPKIQADTGVQIRFLAGLWRHSDDEWNQDEIDRIKALAKSPHIAGIDIMGHETNPTRDMAAQIKELTKWSIENDPNFTIRVHAGENPLFAADTVDAYSYNNVRETMTLVLEARQELADARGVPAESLPLPQIRIGHGLYGADDETIRLFKETGAIVEFNMTSNLSLNNLDHLGEVPLQKYQDAGIKLVLGTDGAGLYRTSAGQEAILARYAGLDADGFTALRDIETRHIDTQSANAQRKAAAFDTLFEQAKQTGQDPWRAVFAPEYNTPDGQPRMNDAVSARKQQARHEYLDGIRSAISENGIVTDPAELARAKAGKVPILITGASKSSWPKISPENQQEIRIAMQLLADQIDPAKAYILTGGTNFGVEKEMHEAAQRRNAAAAEGDKLVVIGTLTTEAKPTEIQRDTVTHAEIVEMNGRPAARWFDLPDATLGMVSENHGTMIAVGGGPVVRDMIQRGHNMGINMLLMNGPEGASTEKSAQFEGKGYSVEGATALVARMHEQHPDWFKPGFNPANLPQYRAQAEARATGLTIMPQPYSSHLEHSLTETKGITLSVDTDKNTGTVTLRLSSELDDVQQRLLSNTLPRVSVTIGGVNHTFPPLAVGQKSVELRLDNAVSQMHATSPLELKIGNEVFGQYHLDATSGQLIQSTAEKLTVTETRIIASGNDDTSIPYPRGERSTYTPATDLHTHFAANLSSDTLIDIALRKDGKPIAYPLDLLRDIGIDPNKYVAGDSAAKSINLNALDGADLDKLRDAMRIPSDVQVMHKNMSRIYAYRGPITKDKSLFGEMLREVAKDYQSVGVKYAELSHASIITDPDLLRIAHEVLPDVERETGVSLRFMAGVWRHATKEWNQDEIDRIKAIAKSPYVAGVDFMGQESNPTRDFESEIRSITRWAIENRPDLAIRIHAGENPIFSTESFENAEKNPRDYHNIRESMQAILKAREEVAQARGVSPETLPLPPVRIGHGLYGTGEKTLDLVKQVGAVVEFNFSSNMALNNINDVRMVPLKPYLDADIPYVLGTDGRWIYQTTPGQEALLAQAAGATTEDLEKLRQFEAGYITGQQAHFEAQRIAFDREFANLPGEERARFAQIFSPTYSTETGQPRMNDDVAKSYREQHRASVQRLADDINQQTYMGQSVVTDSAALARDTQGKQPVLITGASRLNWDKIAEQQPQQAKEISVAMQILADNLDPKKSYVVTGGTNFGVEKQMHEAAARRNANTPGDRLIVEGTLVLQAKAGQIEPNTITHARILELNGKPAARWIDMPEAVINYVTEKHGQMVAVGGGAVVRDMIQFSHNQGEIPMHIMDGPDGASTEKAQALRHYGYEFESAEELVRRIYAADPSLFNADFNPNNLPLIRARSEARLAGVETPQTTNERTTAQPINEKTSGDRTMPTENTPVYTPADVENLPRTQVVNTSVRTLQRIDLAVDDDFTPAPALTTDSKGNPVTVGITEVVRDEAGKITGVKYVNPKDSTDKYAVQTFGVKDGVMVLPTTTEAQASELSRIVQSVSGGQGNTVSLAQFDQILRDTHTYYTQQGMVPDIYNSTTKKFAFDTATQSFGDHSKSDDGVFRKAGGVEEVVVLSGEQGKTLGFHAPSANVGTQYGEGSIVLRRDAKGEWRKLDMEYAVDNLRNPDGSAMDWNKVATVTPEVLDANRLVAYQQAHTDMIRSQSGEPRPLIANGETFTELNNARDAILTNPERLLEARANVVSNGAYLDLVHGRSIIDATADAILQGPSIKVEGANLGTGLGLGLYGLYASAQTFADDMASGDLGQQGMAIARVATDVSDIGLSAAGSIATLRGAATSTVSKVATRAAIPLAVASGVFETATAWQAGDRERAAGAVGATGGGILGGIAVGAVAGAVTGSPTGPGAIVTGLVGAIAGAFAGEKAATEYAEGAAGWVMGTDDDIADMIRGSTPSMRAELGIAEKKYTMESEVSDEDIEKVYAYIKASGMKGISELTTGSNGDSFKLLQLIQENKKLSNALQNLDASWTPYLDDNADGKVDLAELRTVLKEHNVSVHNLDKNGDRNIDADEIGSGLNAALSKPKSANAERE